VRSGEGGGAGVEDLAVDAVAPPEGSALLERIGDPRGEDPVTVGAGASIAAGVEGRIGLDARADGDVARQDRVQAADEALPRPLGLEARDLGGGVDARVRAAGDGERRLRAQDAPQGGLELALDRAQAGLRGPATEPGSVVGDLQPVAGQTSSRKTISVESDRRGPSFTIRV